MGKFLISHVFDQRIGTVLKSIALPIINIAITSLWTTVAQAQSTCDLAQTHQQAINSPEDSFAYREFVQCSQSLAAFSRALELIRARPEWFTEHELLSAEQDAHIVSVRHAKPGQQTSLRMNHDELHGKHSPENTALQIRIANDSILESVRVQKFVQAIEQFEQLRNQQSLVTTPDFVLAAVAESELEIGSPSKAVDLITRALRDRRDPSTWDWRLLKINALHDLQQFAQAKNELARLDADVRNEFKNSANPIRQRTYRQWISRLAIVSVNQARYDANYRLADRLLTQLESVASYDHDVRLVRAALQLNQGMSRESLAHAARVQIDFPESLWTNLAKVDAQTELGLFNDSIRQLQQLRATHGDHRSIEQAQERIKNRQSASISFDWNKQQPLGMSLNSGSRPGREKSWAFRLNAPLIGDHWRLHTSMTSKQSNVDSVTTNLDRVHLGMEYYSPNWILNAGVAQSLGSHGSAYKASVQHHWNDRWSVTGALEKNSDDTASRALLHGVRANPAQLTLSYRSNHHRYYQVSAGSTRWSDSNRRKSASVSWTEVWSQTAKYSLQSELAAYHAQHRSSDVPYFSPKQLNSMTLGLQFEQQILRSSQYQWEHRIRLEASAVRQAGYRTLMASAGFYEHRIDLSSRFGVYANAQISRRPYDGVKESQLRYGAGMYWKMT